MDIKERVRQAIEADIEELRFMGRIQEDSSPVSGATLDDLLSEMSLINPSHAEKMRSALALHNIGSIDDLLRFEPENLERLQGFDQPTLITACDAFERLGFMW